MRCESEALPPHTRKLITISITIAQLAYKTSVQLTLFELTVRYTVHCEEIRSCELYFYASAYIMTLIPSAYWNWSEFSYCDRQMLNPRTVFQRKYETPTSYMSNATWQLSLTTVGASSRVIYSLRYGSTSGVAILPSASAASCRTMSASFGSWRT